MPRARGGARAARPRARRDRRRSRARASCRPRPRSARSAARRRGVRRPARGSRRRSRRRTHARPRPAAASRASRPPATSSSSPARTWSASAPCAASGSIVSAGSRSPISLGEPEPVEAAGGEHERVEPALARLAQPRVDVAAQRLDRDRSARSASSCARRRTDAVPIRIPGSSAARADESVARIVALEVRADDEPCRVRRGHVLRRVDGDVDPAGEQRLLDLLHEHAALADLAERARAVAVAGGRDRHEDDLVARPPDHRAGELGLGQREPRAARADANEQRSAPLVEPEELPDRLGVRPARRRRRPPASSARSAGAGACSGSAPSPPRAAARSSSESGPSFASSAARIASACARSEAIAGTTSSEARHSRKRSASSTTSRSATLGLGAAAGQRLGDDRLEVVDVVEVAAVELVHGGVDVARDGDVDEEQRAAAVRRDVAGVDQEPRRSGRGEHDVDVAELARDLVERERLRRRTASRARGRPRRCGWRRTRSWRRAPRGSRRRARRSARRRRAAPSRPVEIAEDLRRERGGGGRHRGRALADRRLGAHALAELERLAEDAVEQRPGRGGVERRPHLAEDLALAGNQRVEPGGDAEEMDRRGLVVHPVGDRARAARRRAPRARRAPASRRRRRGRPRCGCRSRGRRRRRARAPARRPARAGATTRSRSSTGATWCEIPTSDSLKSGSRRARCARGSRARTRRAPGRQRGGRSAGSARKPA